MFQRLLPLGFLACALLAAAGCEDVNASNKIPTALQPAQGKWSIVASSTRDRSAAILFAGSEVTVRGNTMTFQAAALGGATTAPAPVVRQFTISPPAFGKRFQRITIKPLDGQSGWTLVGVSLFQGNDWDLNLADPQEHLDHDDFNPRDEPGAAITLMKE